ncbi:vitamin K epoxide reductase family protein [Patescibacteria group bacterium AH-259-L07]|nr:vitamin K epoxide reductase family protein [Patescibacteria group bacterium AH-259-L07]
MTPHALLFTLAAIGISETVYLIRKRTAQERPVCVIGQQCHQVLESKYNNIFGIPNEISGLIFYVAISFITAFLVIGIEPMVLWDRLAEVLIAGGVLLSLVFIYLQWRVIKAWCFWCLMSAITVFLMGLIVLISDLTFAL